MTNEENVVLGSAVPGTVNIHAPVVPQPVQTLSAPEPIEAESVQPSSSKHSDQVEYALAADMAFRDEEPQSALDALSTDLMREFNEAEQMRRDTEERWLKDLRQYRGIYDPEVESQMKGSKSFVRRTRVKVKTTDSRVMDLLFPAGNEKNWTCSNTPVPNVSDAMRQQIASELTQRLQREPGKDEIDKGVVDACEQAAKGMTKVIEDQLVEARYKKVCAAAVHSGNLYGTGIIKGPLVERKVRMRYTHDAKANAWKCEPEEYTTPFVDFVPVWRFYPDMHSTELEQCRFVYERHLMSRQEVVTLAQRRAFRRKEILDYLEANKDGMVTVRSFDTDLNALGERDAALLANSGMYEVLERWGWIRGDQLVQAGVKVPEDRMHESFFSNIWMLPNGTIIKAALQPINGVTWPYHIYYFDKDETSIFGEGLASIMRDDQDMLNASVRMMLDNGALTSGPLLEICLDLLATTEHAEQVMPWKVYFRKKEDIEKGPAVRPIQLENNLEWLSKMASMFEQNTDEVTAIPRYMTGENVGSGAAGTASGMSMLMGAANIVLKDLINNWDEGITRTFIQSLYRWNMQFSRDNTIKGDFDVKARGVASLVAKEVRARQINEFSQISNNPADAPFVKRHKLLQMQAEALEMTDVVKTEDELQAESQTEQALAVAKMQKELAEAQLQLAKGQAAKIVAEAEVAKRKVDEILANVELTIAKAVDTKVQTIFAALQAGGVATRDPLTAPAGDAILRDAGYKEAVPNPSTAQLNGPPVQQQEASMRVMGRGEAFAEDPRVVAPSTNGDVAAEPPADPAAAVPGTAQPADPSGHVGQRAGIETTELD